MANLPSLIQGVLVGLGITAIATIHVKSNDIRTEVAIQTATLAELTGPNAPVVYVKNLDGDNSLPETFYDKAYESNGKTYSRRCFLALDGQAVPNTCYEP